MAAAGLRGRRLARRWRKTTLRQRFHWMKGNAVRLFARFSKFVYRLAKKYKWAALSIGVVALILILRYGVQPGQ
ncbi:hypothetical protein DACRYDRAFT_104206 [Dacryopinax primogenitus]|uniref:Uncharacterized protein n=1 Tax=Dacryopinax primogenitus (strain DJM 731) TaxID=1858805 RepID=M5GBF9_DACPD|nr:uncharacterized protein DACRYDRAFT_104206 [Dacryopinax primogenitus]EJU05720.1 hypothetical protein DACRYDRAFT_104206 [Dacryopinax primogenitus]